MQAIPPKADARSAAGLLSPRHCHPPRNKDEKSLDDPHRPSEASLELPSKTPGDYRGESSNSSAPPAGRSRYQPEQPYAETARNRSISVPPRRERLYESRNGIP